MNKLDKLMEENAELVAKWSEYVKVSLKNGKPTNEIRGRLRENNLTDGEIDLLFNPEIRNYVEPAKRAKFQYIGIAKLVGGLFVLSISDGYLAGILPAILLIGTGVFWLLKGAEKENGF